MYKDGNRKRERYMGERTVEALEAYVRENLKAHGIKDELWNFNLVFHKYIMFVTWSLPDSYKNFAVLVLKKFWLWITKKQ